MLRGRSFPTVSVLFVVALLLAGCARPAFAEPAGALSEVPLPGGLRAALAAINDRVTPDRSRFLLEFIRRTYQTSAGAKHEQHEATLRALLAHLDLAARNDAAPDTTADTIPLPLTPAIWIDVVFGGRSSAKTLVADIIRSRAPSLLYYALVSLDDDTRAWLATERDLLRELAGEYAPAFVAAAPALRVAGGTVRVPGGEPARQAWEALVGRPVTDPAAFVRALVSESERRIPCFYAVLAQLTPQQTAYLLRLDAPDPGARVDALRRIHGIYERLAPGWRIEERTFWRPSNDPALLVAELSIDAEGRPMLPGTRHFWAAAFSDDDRNLRDESDRRALADGEAVDIVWLCEQVFSGDMRRRYPSVLFASRLVRQITPHTVVDALDAVRAVPRFPALVAALERANIRDVTLFASAARHAARLSAIDDSARAARAMTQFQGALSVLVRAARRGGINGEAVPGLVGSLASVELNARGEYEGRMVRWLETLLGNAAADEAAVDAAGPVERALIRLLAGGQPSDSHVVEWEGTRYRVDFRWAEMRRLARILGEEPRPHLSSARTIMDVADALAAPGLTHARLSGEMETLRNVADALGAEDAASLQRFMRGVDVRSAPRLAASLRGLADSLLAAGLLEITYAAALGNPDRVAITASDAAGRHDFGLAVSTIRSVAPWRFPSPGTRLDREWGVTGSLLGLDVKLAEFSLVAVSSKPPLKRPSVPDEDRRLFIEAVALVEAGRLTERDRDDIVAAVRLGRERLAGIRTTADAAALAEEVRLSSAQRSLLAWAATYDGDSVPRFLPYSDLVSLGLGKDGRAAMLNAWGAPAEPRLGCLCLQFFNRSLESLEGRWNSGILASGFTDLNLRLGELLADLRMPAALLPSVLASAMLDFINTAECRDPDDRRGLVDFVQRLGPDRVEQYLALLTSDGPLVPLGEGSSEVGR